RTSSIKNLVPPSAGRSWHRVRRSFAGFVRPNPFRQSDQTPAPLAPGVVSSRHRSGLGALGSVGRDRQWSSARVPPPRRSLPSVPHRSFVSFSSSSAPSTHDRAAFVPPKGLVRKSGSSSRVVASGFWHRGGTTQGN